MKEKSSQEIAEVAKEIINVLAKNNCSVAEADKILRIARISIDDIATVQKLEY